MRRDDVQQVSYRIGTPSEWLDKVLPKLNDEQRWQYHLRFTPAHEAGHAVAMRLAGHDIHDISVASVYKRVSEPWGYVRSARHYNGKTRLQDDFLAQEGLAGPFREMVSALAGPAVEIRLGGADVGTGMLYDYDIAAEWAKWFQSLNSGLTAEKTLQAAWDETHRMVSDTCVWATIQAIAEQINGSRHTPLTDMLEPAHSTSGEIVHSIIAHHLPNGWAYRLPEWAE